MLHQSTNHAAAPHFVLPMSVLRLRIVLPTVSAQPGTLGTGEINKIAPNLIDVDDLHSESNLEMQMMEK